MKITISILTLLFVATSVLSAFSDNPTAPSDYFLKFEGDYTDTDGDGMTDVAEKDMVLIQGCGKSLLIMDILSQKMIMLQLLILNPRVMQMTECISDSIDS